MFTPSDESGPTNVSINLNFKYYQLHKLFKVLNQNSSNLSFLHTNIRSINKNLDELSCLIKTTKGRFHLIGLSEIWEPDSTRKKTYTIPGYHEFQFIEGTTQNSGCGIFIKDDIKFQVRDNLNTSFCTLAEEFQIYTVEIFVAPKNMLISVVYRHPKGNSIDEFKNSLKKVFNRSRLENKKLIMMGDFNIDLLKSNQNEMTAIF